MGIFGNKQQSDQFQDDNSAVQQPASQPQGSIDGLLPAHTATDPAMQQSVDNVLSQSAPTLDDAADDYIMTDPPAPQQPTQWDDQTPQNDDQAYVEPAYEQEPVEQPAPEPQASQEPAIPVSVSTSGDTVEELSAIKQEALKQLSPLVGHLEQSPEEKFHTTMMMLQATDDQALVKTAYEAAQAITDEKARAQALLDVVNEINYFTQNKH